MSDLLWAAICFLTLMLIFSLMITSGRPVFIFQNRRVMGMLGIVIFALSFATIILGGFGIYQLVFRQ